jgi:oligoendopeptidase F
MSHPAVATARKYEAYSVPTLPQRWEEVAPFFAELVRRPLHNLQDLEQWLLDRSHIESLVGEWLSWAYIKLSANNADEQANLRYQYVVQNLVPKMAPLEQELNQKLANCPFSAQLDSNLFNWQLKHVQNSNALYRAENVQLQTEVQLQTKEYGRIFSQMLIGVDGKQMTLPQASTILEEPDRQRRRAIYHQINRRILQDTERLETLFDNLLDKRQEMAANTGFENYRDFAFRQMGRFDYTPEDCLHFHEVMKAEIVPILNELYSQRRERLGVEHLRPWDLNTDANGQDPVQAFANEAELISKSVHCLRQVHPLFGDIIELMHEQGLTDLSTRPGKRPGGYNMPLQATRMPFLFMNASNTLGDLRTFMHESGHAIHFFLTRDYELLFQRRFTFEVAELMAMGMELLTMEHWETVLPDPTALRRAKIAQLEHSLKVLPWIATIDRFQHWLYTHPEHTHEERRAYWKECFYDFTPGVLDYSGLERYIEHLWHKQLHLFEAPFYYIEYGFAQLGAIALWRNYRQDPEKTIAQFISAMKLGNTRSIREIYAEAGIGFDFSAEYVRELAAFVRGEIVNG